MVRVASSSNSYARVKLLPNGKSHIRSGRWTIPCSSILGPANYENIIDFASK